MLSVLLKILTVLGIILLIILGIIIFVLLIVVFVPITYRLYGQIDKDHKEATVKVNWLFGILRFTLHYSENLTWKLKVFGFDLTGVVKKNRDAKTKTVNVKEKTHDAESLASEAVAQISEDNKHFSEDSPKVSEKTTQAVEETAQAADEFVNKGLSEKINGLILKIQSILTKIKEIWAKITYYLSVLQEDDTQDLISHIFRVLGKILKSIRPRKLIVDAVIGFDSPDTTGKVYGFLCMLYPYYGNDIHITPDFENKVLEGNLFCRGRIYICVLAWNALVILLDRKLFKVIHKLKNGGKRKNGR